MRFDKPLLAKSEIEADKVEADTSLFVVLASVGILPLIVEISLVLLAIAVVCCAITDVLLAIADVFVAIALVFAEITVA